MKQEIKLLTITLLVAFLLCGAVSAESSTNDSKIEAQLMNVSVPFVENQGQINPEVSYYANTFYGTSYITSDGITHQINGKDNKTLVVKEQFLDKNGNTITFNAQGEAPSTAVVSYFKGENPDNWHTQLSTYNFINLGELYPGITVKLRAAGSNIEKLFFVSPGANPDDIRIQILGTDQLTMDAEGNLIIKSEGFSDVSMSKPVAYQDDNKNIEAEYQTRDNTYQFKIGDYDHTKQLTIDPMLQYSTYLGGNKNDNAWAIAVDALGNAYITGSTRSNNFPTTPGANQTTLNGTQDVFVTKLNPDGTTLLYSTYLGGNNAEGGYGIAVDALGNAYITGYTKSNNFPTTPGANQTTLNGVQDAFVTKLNPTGTTVLYSTYLGGNNFDNGRGIAVDGEGNAYITGETYSDDFPTEGAYQTTHKGGGYDAFVTKLNPTGTTLLYSTYLGGNQIDYGWGIAVDAEGNAYITGYTSSTNFPTEGAYQTTLNGTQDAFVTKLNPTGTTLLYSTYLGGNKNDNGKGIAVDAEGNAYITGETYSDDFPTTPGANQIHQGYVDAFVTKLNPTGTTLLYSTYLGGNKNDNGRGIAVDAEGNAYITGYTSSNNFPTTPGANKTTLNGTQDAFVTKLNPTGTTLLYSTYLGGTSSDYGWGIAVDAEGNAYITGYTSSNNFPTTPGANQTTLNGTQNAFVAKFNIVPIANVTITKTGNGPLNVGEPGKFIVTLYNNGPNDAHNIVVTDTNIPTGWTVSTSLGSWNATTNKWIVGTLQNGETAWLNITGPITTTMAGTTLTNTVIETQDELNLESQNSTANIVVNSLPASSDLYINTWSSKTYPLVGEIYTLTFKLGNRGPDTAENVVFILPLPDGVEFVDVNVDQGAAAYDPGTRTIKWTVGDVVVGDPYAWVRVKSLTLGSFTFKPTLTTDTYNPNIENNIQAATVTIKADGEPSSKTVHAQTIGMQKTGLPIMPLVLSILSILSAITSQRKK